MKQIAFLLGLLVLSPASFAFGGKIAFLGFEGSFWQVFSIDEKGGSLTALTDTAFDKTRISIDRKNKRLLYCTSDGRVFIHDIKSHRDYELNIGLSGMTDAVIDPTGNYVAFSLSTTNSIDLNDIWLYHINTTKLKKLTNDKGLQHYPTWSPDGKKVLFLSGKGAAMTHDIFAIDTDGKSMTQLTAGSYYNFGAMLSVQGDIVFSSNRKDSYDLYTMRPTGAQVQRITSEPSFEGEPGWSANGRKIVYVSTEAGKRQLCIINKDGSGKKLVPTKISVRKPIWLD